MNLLNLKFLKFYNNYLKKILNRNKKKNIQIKEKLNIIKVYI